MHSRPSAHGPAGATDSPHPEPVSLGSDFALSVYVLISEPFSLGSQEHGRCLRLRQIPAAQDRVPSPDLSVPSVNYTTLKVRAASCL